MPKLAWFAVGGLLLVAVVYQLWPERRGTDTPPAITEHNGGHVVAIKSPAYLSRLKLAVATAVANAACGYSDTGGYAYYTPAEAARRLVNGMNAASAPAPADPPVPGPNVSYVLDRPTGPWQVVIKADEVHERLVIDGYSLDLTKPVVSEHVPCS